MGNGEAGSGIEREAASLVEDLHAAFGKHGARAVYAKGIILSGTFTPSSEARDLSKAAVFAATAVPVIVRFSSFTGIPDIPDTAPQANPKGLAVRLDLPGEDRLDLVTHSFNGFPAVSSREFGELLRAVAASGPGTTKPTALDSFLAAHPAAEKFFNAQKPPPVSYATAAYYGVNAVMFVGWAGRRTHARYRIVPEAGEHYLDDADLRSKGTNYLSEEIRARLIRAPITFSCLAQLAGRGDRIDDPSMAWPESRRLVPLGGMTIDRLEADQIAADKQLSFAPGTMPPGIEPADRMLAIRDAAYAISFGKRR